MFIKLCDQLKNARQSIGLTQDQVAEKLHISRQAVSQWETGKSYPDIENLRLLNSIYSTDLSELLNCKPKKTPHVSILNRRFLITVIFVGVLGIFLCYVNRDSFGYQWQCLDGDHYKSKIHLFPDSAVDKANAHASQSGHRVSIFKR